MEFIVGIKDELLLLLIKIFITTGNKLVIHINIRVNILLITTVYFIQI